MKAVRQIVTEKSGNTKLQIVRMLEQIKGTCIKLVRLFRKPLPMPFHHSLIKAAQRSVQKKHSSLQLPQQAIANAMIELVDVPTCNNSALFSDLLKRLEKSEK